MAPLPDLACVQVGGTGKTIGDRNQLVGDGLFLFDEVERTAVVGLYLFDITPAGENGLNVDTQYQFHWDNGDSFLTKDKVYFEPTFEANTYRFSVSMSITAGSGMFSTLVGKKPLTLSAEMVFGPPKVPGGVLTVTESFDVSGSVCGEL